MGQMRKEAGLDMVENNSKMPHKHLDYFERLCCLAERANEYKSKYASDITDKNL